MYQAIRPDRHVYGTMSHSWNHLTKKQKGIQEKHKRQSTQHQHNNNITTDQQQASTPIKTIHNKQMPNPSATESRVGKTDKRHPKSIPSNKQTNR